MVSKDELLVVIHNVDYKQFHECSHADVWFFIKIRTGKVIKEEIQTWSDFQP